MTGTITRKTKKKAKMEFRDPIPPTEKNKMKTSKMRRNN